MHKLFFNILPPFKKFNFSSSQLAWNFPSPDFLFVEFPSNLPRVQTKKGKKEFMVSARQWDNIYLCSIFFRLFRVTSENMFLRFESQQIFRGKKHWRNCSVEHVFTSSYKTAINQILSKNVFQSRRNIFFLYLFRNLVFVSFRKLAISFLSVFCISTMTMKKCAICLDTVLLNASIQLWLRSPC